MQNYQENNTKWLERYKTTNNLTVTQWVIFCWLVAVFNKFSWIEFFACLTLNRYPRFLAKTIPVAIRDDQVVTIEVSLSTVNVLWDKVYGSVKLTRRLSDFRASVREGGGGGGQRATPSLIYTSVITETNQTFVPLVVILVILWKMSFPP
jgi:hypothetical protein